MKRQVLFLAALCVLSGCGLLNQPTDPSDPPKNEVSYTAIGASDAIGFGSSAVCIPFTECPNGMGYVPQIVRRLQTAGKTALSAPSASTVPPAEPRSPSARLSINI